MPELIVILGGPYISAFPEESLRFYKAADFAFNGEAEVGLPLLLGKLARADKGYKNIPGLIWRKNGKVIINKKKAPVRLDSLPDPAWDLLKPET